MENQENNTKEITAEEKNKIMMELVRIVFDAQNEYTNKFLNKKIPFLDYAEIIVNYIVSLVASNLLNISKIKGDEKLIEVIYPLFLNGLTKLMNESIGINKVSLNISGNSSFVIASGDFNYSLDQKTMFIDCQELAIATERLCKKD